jgi:hypothetical protein
MSQSSHTSSGLGLCSVLFIVFLVLKLCGVIDWSWWWVTAPLWGGLALVLIILLAVLVITGVAVGVAWLFGRGSK